MTCFKIGKCKKFINIRHENLAPVEDYGMLENELFILMPFYEDGDLTTFINEKGHSLSDKNIIQIFHQIAESLAHLHKLKIIHRDIKLKNIFVSNYEKISGDIHVVLGDFGCFLDLESQNDNQHLLGSESYRPPEKEQTTKADVWSLGVCILQLVLIQQKSSLNLTSEILFNQEDKQKLFQSISVSFVILNQIIYSSKDSDLKDVLTKCLDSTFSSRIDSYELSNTLRILTKVYSPAKAGTQSSLSQNYF